MHAFDALLIAMEQDTECNRDFELTVLDALRSFAAQSNCVIALAISKQALGEDAMLDMQAAAQTGALLGMWRSLALEVPAARLRWVDVAGSCNWQDAVAAALAEEGACDDSIVVRLRAKQRWMPRLRPEIYATPTQSALRRHGTYVVVGALGELGILLCRQLLRCWSAHVIGVVRPDATRGPQRTQTCSELAALGSFDLVEEDVSAGNLAAAIERRFGPELRVDGAFHLGATFNLCPLSELGRDAYLADTAAKRNGTLALIDMLVHIGSPQPLLVAYGSVNSEFGATGAAAYAAACTAQQLICTRSAQYPQLRCYYLGWSQWTGRGLSSRNPLAPLAQRLGFLSIDPALGMRSLERALAGPPGCVLIGLDGTHEEVVASLAQPVVQPRLKLQATIAELTAVGADTQGADRFDRLYEISHDLSLSADAAPATARYHELELLLKQLWQQVLQREDVSTRQSFFEAGGNSLRLLQAKGMLEQRLARAIDVETLFRFPTIQQLALHLAQLEAPVRETAETVLDPALARGMRRRQLRAQP
jgi:hypothetical protein